MKDALSPREEVYKLYPINCPDRPSPNANQGRRGPDLPRKAEGKS